MQQICLQNLGGGQPQANQLKIINVRTVINCVCCLVLYVIVRFFFNVENTQK